MMEGTFAERLIVIGLLMIAALVIWIGTSGHE